MMSEDKQQPCTCPVDHLLLKKEEQVQLSTPGGLCFIQSDALAETGSLMWDELSSHSGLARTWANPLGVNVGKERVDLVFTKEQGFITVFGN